MRSIHPVLLLTVIALLASSAAAQGTITVVSNTEYSQRSKLITVTIGADAAFTDIKAVQLDIDVDPAVLQADPASISLGNLWVNDPDSTFFFYSLSPDHSRLTIDIAVLGNGRTKSGPGTLAEIRFNTADYGVSDIAITGCKVRDTLNQPVTVTTVNDWVEVCRFVGDLDASDVIDGTDLAWLVAYLTVRDTPAPTPFASANCDCRGIIDGTDLAWLVYYIVGPGKLCRLCM